LGTAVLGVEDFEGLLQEATEEVSASLGAEFVSIHLEQGGHRWEYRFDRHGRVPASFAPQLPPRLVEATGCRSQVLTSGAAKGLAEAGLRCAVVTPVPISREEALTLCVAFGEPGRVLVGEDLEGLEEIATVLALGASRATFQALAVYDPATGLYNKRWLDASLPGEVERARRYKQPFALLLLDVDRFKQINDVHGHLTGDKTLAEVARVLTESIRSCDAAARIGGDEFAILLPATGATGAERIARRILERVRGLSLGDALTPVRVTVSGGVALVDGQSTAQSLFVEADQALYAAKRSGRDAVQVPERTPVFDEEIAMADRGRRRVAGV
jgi:diguanylate cyclase (GGDEF)-like protein